MKPFTKADLQAAFDIIDRQPLKAQTLIMSKQDYDDIYEWEIPFEEWFIKEMKRSIEIAETKKFLVSRVKEGQNLDMLRKIVVEHFPQYLEMLDKLLVLR